jgi:hypothetical protein
VILDWSCEKEFQPLFLKSATNIDYPQEADMQLMIITAMLQEKEI